MTRKHRRADVRYGLMLVGIAAVVAASAAPAAAIPAFARKYQTSCQTCHIAYPKLNPFGEAFRLRGYRMPGETEEQIKEKPISLGAPAYKRLWPQAVWPSDMPGTIPFAVDIAFADLTRRTAEEETGAKETFRNDFRFPQSIELLMGGTLGETLSFLGEVELEREFEEGVEELEVAFEHGQLNFNGPFGSGTRFNLKVGRFVPEAFQPFGHSALLTSDGPATFFEFNPIAPEGGVEVGGEHGGGIAVPHSVDGLEVYGILGHRLLYSGGLSNGIGPGRHSADGNQAKDVYGRVAFKIGGLPFDGEGYTPSEKNWREKSLRVGLFAYRGDGSDIFFPAAGHENAQDAMEVSEGRLLEDRRFTRIGVDANAFFQDLNVIVGYVRGRDTLALYAAHDEGRRLEEHGDFTYHTWFIEGDYVLLPWLHGALRYEWLRPAREGAADFKRLVPNLTALIRANVKAFIEFQRDLGESDNYRLLATVRFAF